MSAVNAILYNTKLLVVYMAYVFVLHFAAAFFYVLVLYSALELMGNRNLPFDGVLVLVEMSGVLRDDLDVVVPLLPASYLFVEPTYTLLVDNVELCMFSYMDVARDWVG